MEPLVLRCRRAATRLTQDSQGQAALRGVDPECPSLCDDLWAIAAPRPHPLLLPSGAFQTERLLRKTKHLTLFLSSERKACTSQGPADVAQGGCRSVIVAEFQTAALPRSTECQYLRGRQVCT